MKTLREKQEQHIARARATTLQEVARATGYPEQELAALYENDDLFSGGVKKLREAVSASSFAQLLRGGVQTFLFDGYNRPQVVYPDLVRVVNSNKAEELYAPLFRGELPKTVRPGQSFEDSRLQGLDVHLANLKFGRMLTVEREMVDDDQTGQIVQKAMQMGEDVRQYEEQLVVTAILGASYTTTIGNVLSGGGALSQTNLEGADVALEQMKDPLGNLILVQPDTLFVSPSDKFNAAKLLQSALQPSVPGGSGQTASTASSQATGWTMTANPLQGLYAIKSSRYLHTSTSSTKGLDSTNGNWFLLEAKKSIVWQDRDALEVVQEAANAGEAFNRDVFRYRVRRRGAAGVIDSRFIYQGN